MRYRIKLTVVTQTSRGSTVILDKYFREASIKKTLLKESKYLQKLVSQGYKILTTTSIGAWVN